MWPDVCSLSQPDELQKTLAFVSISTDGDVMLWTLAKCELLPERLMRLQSTSKDKAAGAGAAAVAALSASGSFGASAAAAAAGGGSSGAAGAVGLGGAADLSSQQHVVGGLCMDFSKVGIRAVASSSNELLREHELVGGVYGHDASSIRVGCTAGGCQLGW